MKVTGTLCKYNTKICLYFSKILTCDAHGGARGQVRESPKSSCMYTNPLQLCKQNPKTKPNLPSGCDYMKHETMTK